jgi:hypothetical protein
MDKFLNDLMSQFEENQKALERMQRQQSELKKRLDDMAAERKKLFGDLPTPSRRGP